MACSNPECPNEKRIKELEAEIVKLKIALIRAQDDLKREQELGRMPKFRYPD